MLEIIGQCDVNSFWRTNKNNNMSFKGLDTLTLDSLW
jgi:hypothetical protein